MTTPTWKEFRRNCQKPKVGIFGFRISLAARSFIEKQSADIVTPTAMNAASAEHIVRCVADQSGNCNEMELTGRLEVIVRAFDPCLSCAVH